ncbi:hypothetical protein GCK32_019746 [Trichostrongylus colubriformis]|uniref:Uncharacterized protein n=1 Tax=Trichostrongylus colubriformis TaxID=6319 RepID=A0AAN8FVS5_TRICO
MSYRRGPFGTPHWSQCASCYQEKPYKNRDLKLR